MITSRKQYSQRNIRQCHHRSRNMPDQLKIFQNFQSPSLDIKTPWIWFKDLIWAVSAGRGFSTSSWKMSRINALAVEMAGTMKMDQATIDKMKPKASAQVDSELAWLCQLVNATSFDEACTWMALTKQVTISDPDKQYRYGIPSRITTNTPGKAALPENNASFVNYLADACKLGLIGNVQLIADGSLNNIQPSILYLST